MQSLRLARAVIGVALLAEVIGLLAGSIMNAFAGLWIRSFISGGFAIIILVAGAKWWQLSKMTESLDG